MSDLDFLKECEKEHFIFGVRNTWSEIVYGEHISYQSCVLVIKRDDLFYSTPQSEIWLNNGSDMPPQLRDAIKYLTKQKIKKVYTTEVPIREGGFGGLTNHYVPEDWDYDEDPYPEGEVYYIWEHGNKTSNSKKTWLDDERKIELIKLNNPFWLK